MTPPPIPSGATLSRSSASSPLTDDQGASLLELAILLPVLILLLFGAVDYGRAWYVKLEVASAAEAGALYGIRFPSDVTGMQIAAIHDAPDVPGLQASASFGSECSDGSAPIPLATTSSGCSVNAIGYVEVDTNATNTPILAFSGFVSPLTMTAKSRLRTGE